MSASNGRRLAASNGRRLAASGRPFALAGLLAVALLVAPGVALPAGPFAPPAATAAEELRIQGDATYLVEAEDQRVRVVLTITATNLKPPTTQALADGRVRQIRYFWERLNFRLQPGSVNVRATIGGATTAVSTATTADYVDAVVSLRSTLDYRETQTIRLEWHLPGGAPRSLTPTRVGLAYATFPAWAWGDPDRGTVRVEMADAFVPTLAGMTLVERREGARRIFESGVIDDPDRWWAVISGAQPDALARTEVEIPNAPRVIVQSWPEDEAWRDRVADLFRRGLPELRERIGLDWRFGALRATEVHTPVLEGYAGTYDVRSDEIEIGEDLGARTIIHEAAHSWFNHELLSGRWISEGLAEAYAGIVLEALGEETEARDPVRRDDAAAVPLNAWNHPGRIADQETSDREQYGYTAAGSVTRRIVDLVGEPAMREVFAAAARGEIAYIGAGEPERPTRTVAWRQYLDLLEERGGTDEVAGIFRTWVVTDHDAMVLDRRADARDRYGELLVAGGDWRPPILVRQPMSAWTFAAAIERIAEAEAVLARRDRIAEAAGALELDPPGALRPAYESADASFDEAIAIAESELVALHAIEVATRTVGAERDVLVTIGLYDLDPEVALATARDAYGTGDAERATAAAERATQMVLGAAAVGEERVLIGIGATAAGGVSLTGLILAAAAVRGRRRRAAAIGGPFRVPAISIWIDGAAAADVRSGDATSAAIPEATWAGTWLVDAGLTSGAPTTFGVVHAGGRSGGGRPGEPPPSTAETPAGPAPLDPGDTPYATLAATRPPESAEAEPPAEE